MNKIKKALASLGIAGTLAAGFTAAPVVSADLGIGNVSSAEAASYYNCYIRYVNKYPLTPWWERVCYVDYNWWEETWQNKHDGWYVVKTSYTRLYNV